MFPCYLLERSYLGEVIHAEILLRADQCLRETLLVLR